MFGRETRERAAGKATLGAARGAGKAVLGAGKVLKGGAKSRTARKTARGAGKATLKGGWRIGSTGRSIVPPYLKYGFFALFGFAVGALVARSGNRQDASTFTGTTGQHTPDAGGSAAGMVSDPAAPASHQRSEDPNRTGAEREYSDPSAGPLIGRSHRDRTEDIPVQEEEVENRIRTRVGEEPRTLDLPHLNVEVNDGVADIRGEVHTEEEKQAVEEIASNTEGVTEVRNLLTVNPDAPSRHKGEESSHQA